MTFVATLPCTRAQADRARDADDPFPAHAEATLVAAETADGWELRLYTAEAPDDALLQAFQVFAPGARPAVAPLAEEDWVTLSQAGLDPVDLGRFHVHTGEHRGHARPGQIVFRIDAGLAFGTAHHPTTAGCLRAAQSRRLRPRTVLDLGTGSGLLAFAAHRLHRRARVTASDIDPVSIDVARDNARLNRVPLGRGSGRLHLLAAPGLAHRDLAARAPYDLVFANILAGPLVALAPGLARAVAPGGTLILAGLLRSQAPRVLAVYAARGLVRAGPAPKAEWPVLVLTRPGQSRSRVTRGVRETAGRRPTASAW